MWLDVTATILLIAFALFYLSHSRIRPNVPVLSFLEYLPNGILHPIAKDPRTFQRTLLKAVRKYGRVFYFWMGANNFLLTAYPEDICQVMSSHKFRRPDSIMETFRAMAPFGLICRPVHERQAINGALHHQLGPQILPKLHNKTSPIIHNMVMKLKQAATSVDSDGKTSPVDIAEVLSVATCEMLTNVALGAQMGEAENVRFANAAASYFDEIMLENVGYPIRQFLTFLGIRSKFLKCKKEVDKMCVGILEKRLNETETKVKSRHPDILDIFVDLFGDNVSTTASLLAEFSLGGSHAPAQLIAWAIYETCGNELIHAKIDEQLENVLGNKPWNETLTMEELDNLTYLRKIWKETLRLHHVSGGVSRVAVEAETLKGSGIRVHKGQEMLLFVSGCQIDREIWSEPTVFKPERWGSGDSRGEGDKVPPGSYLPYSMGHFSCGGRFFAEYEGPLLLAELFRRFKFSLACGRDEIISCSSFVDFPRYAGKKLGNSNMGLPVRVVLKS